MYVSWCVMSHGNLTMFNNSMTPVLYPLDSLVTRPTDFQCSLPSGCIVSNRSFRIITDSELVYANQHVCTCCYSDLYVHEGPNAYYAMQNLHLPPDVQAVCADLASKTNLKS